MPARGRHPLTGNYRYNLWRIIKRRCLDEQYREYRYYGGLGVTMHNAWIDDFQAFADHLDAELGPKPGPFTTLARIDNNGGFEPGNLEWVGQDTPDLRGRGTSRLGRIPEAPPLHTR